MSLQRPTLEEIYSRITADMQARVSSETKILRYSLLGILATVFSGAVHLVYGFISNIALQLFPDTATVEYLDRQANLYNLPRKSATFATGSVQFTGTTGTIISEGTQVQTEEGLVYSTAEEVTIDNGLATADIQADTEGSIGNTTAVEMQLVAPLTGVDTTVDVTETPNGGQDTETDTALRERLLQRLQNPPASGTAADYERWAREVPGVGNAWTKAADDYAGAGTVAIVISTADLAVVDPAVKEETQVYIDSVRPVGVRSDVLDIIPQDTILDIKTTPNTAEIQESVDSNLAALFLSESSPGGTLLLSHIRSAIAAAGVVDYEITQINLNGVNIGVENIVTTGYNTAVFSYYNPSDL